MGNREGSARQRTVSPLRKKRDERRKAKSRRGLIDAAAKVFARKGYHRALVSDIVKEAGFGQGTFYRHFANKRILLDAMLEEFMEQAFAEFRDLSNNLPETDGEFRDAVFRTNVRLLRFLENNRGVARILMRDASSVDEEFEQRVAGYIDRFVILDRFYLEHAIRKGFARPCDLRVVPEAIIGVALRVLDKWWDGGFDGMTLEQVIRESVDFVFYGHSGEKASSG